MSYNLYNGCNNVEFTLDSVEDLVFVVDNLTHKDISYIINLLVEAVEDGSNVYYSDLLQWILNENTIVIFESMRNRSDKNNVYYNYVYLCLAEVHRYNEKLIAGMSLCRFIAEFLLECISSEGIYELNKNRNVNFSYKSININDFVRKNNLF